MSDLRQAPFDPLSAPLRGLQLVEASAGTGKTYTLCALYLRLLLESRLEVRQILVVTFTNAAVAELRSRIRARIQGLSERLRGPARGDDPFADALLARLRAGAAAGDADLQARLDQALASFDEVAIHTIHAFCQRALADGAFAAGMPLQLEQLDDDEDLRLRIVHDFWRRHLAGETLDPAFAAHLVASRTTPHSLAAQLQRRLARPLAEYRWPDNEAPPAADLAAWRSAHAAARSCWQAGRERIAAIVDEARPRLHKSHFTESAVQQALASWDRLLDPEDPLHAPAGLARLDLLTPRRLRPTGKQAEVPPHPFFKLAQALLDARAQCAAACEHRRIGLLRELLDEGPAALRRAKIEQRVVGFDDMLANLHARLSGEQGDALAGALRERYPAALIDEFQDTDPQQFEILDRLYGAGGAPVFLVGDPKQAIYAFRNADLHAYLHARERIGCGGTLLDNQRSTQGLIDALNALFARNPQAFVLPGLQHHRVAFGAKPREALHDDTGAARAPLQLWRLPAQGDGQPLPKPQALHAAAAACADEIVRLIIAARAGRVRIGERRAGAGDIAVLVRTHRHGAIVRRALSARGVGSIELAQASVFAGPDAAQLAQVLAAIAEPSRETLLRAALATEAMGRSARDIDALGADATALGELALRFDGCRRTWLRHGVARMLRQWMAGEGVAARLLARDDGERRMTNLAHLVERLHAAEHEHPSPAALLHWLRAQCAAPRAGDDTLLRLESDRDLVQVVTIHRSKGLEYPFVFCPLLFDGHGGRQHALPDGLEYHADDGRVVIDFRVLDEAQQRAVKASRALERQAETVRLLYVALTRAVHRCHVVVGAYASGAQGSTAESQHSALNGLAAADGRAASSPAEADARWQALADDSNGAIALDALPAPTGATLAPALPAPHAIEPLPAPAHIEPGWAIASYSSLVHGARHETAARDHDLRSLPLPDPADAGPAAPAADDILHFPRGAAAGDCLHALFEAADFGSRDGWGVAIDAVLARHAAAWPDDAGAAQRPAMLARLLDDVLHTPLPGGAVLARVPRRQRLVEMEFHLPARGIQPAALAGLMRTHGYPAPPLGADRIAGYLRGFIDLVFAHDGRHYIVDWKSNHLGSRPDDYAGAALQRAMDGQGYHLQYLLYALALHRHLQWRLDDYDYERHFGGVLYLFVRGVRPAWRDASGAPCGVYAHRPAAAVIDELSRLFAGDAR